MNPPPHPPSRARTELRHARRPAALSGLALMIGVLLATFAGVAPANAAEDDITINVFGTLKNDEKGGEPVPGVTLTATGPDGTSATGETNERGSFTIEVTVPAEGGTVSVELDEGTLPEGVTLREGRPNPLELSVTPGSSSKAASFPLGADNRQVAGKWDRIPQLIYNGLLFGIILALGALGLSMVFGTTGLTNFSHGELVTFGALAAFLVNSTFEMPFAVATVVAVLAGGLLGFLQDRLLWGPLRKRGTGLIAMMIVSIGLMFLLRNLFQYFTQGRTQNYREYVTPSGQDFLGITYTVRDLVMAGVSIVVLVGVTQALSRTRLGRATRAVSDNPALASATGINVNQVITLVWVVGGALAALCGVFLGFTLGVTFTIGQLVLLLLFAAVTVGGLGSIWGALLGSLIIGLLIELSTLVIPSDLKNAGALVLLALILLLRPQGLLGRKERIG